MAKLLRDLVDLFRKGGNACRPASPSEEMEFLPASLEVVATPPSPIGRALLWIIVIFVVSAVVWACLGKVDVVAVADGKIIPAGRVKTIQPMELGVVTNILVQEGQKVSKGDLLIELDTTSSGADVNRLKSELIAAQLEEARIKAILRWNPGSPAPKLIAPDGASDFDVEQERRLLRQDIDALTAELRAYDNELIRLQAQMMGASHTVLKLQGTLPIITKRATVRKKLHEQGVATEADWMEAEENRIEVEQDLKTAEQSLAEAKAAIQVARDRKQQTISEYRRDALERKTKTSTDVESLIQELRKATQRDTLQRIVSPVDGKVQQLSVHTVGGVVTAAQALMIIVPEDLKLEVEAKILNKDIGFVHEGQEVEVKLEAFPFTEYGTIPGTVTRVSNDAVQTEQGDLFYLAKVDLGQSYIMVNGKKVNLAPGMRATAEVKIRQRRLIEFFLSPLLKYAKESMKER